MPDYLKKLFTVNDKIVTYRTTPDGYFQARFRRDGYKIEVAAKNFDTLFLYYKGEGVRLQSRTRHEAGRARI